MDIFIPALAFIAAPLILWFIDAYISISSKGWTYKIGEKENTAFTILIPIYGQIKYLETVDYLSQYGDKVMLLTTGGESVEFMSELNVIAKKNNFQIFISDWTSKQDVNKRATSGTIRDRLIRDALKKVTTTYSVPLDADSITIKNIAIAVSELEQTGADIASVKLVPSNGDINWLTKLQKLEYRIAMDMRQVVPWLISGACQIAKTDALEEIMSKHSLFFQGNDVEIGLLAKRMGYQVVHIPFEVQTALPDKLKPWIRQRLAWAGGEFRLFIVNIKQIIHHPFFWFYGAFIVIAALPLRYIALASTGVTLLIVFGLYMWLVFFMHWKFRNGWLILMPLYSLVSSLILVPIGIYMYFYMAYKDKNMGIISQYRNANS